MNKTINCYQAEFQLKKKKQVPDNLFVLPD